jgi:hypothetical protein
MPSARFSSAICAENFWRSAIPSESFKQAMRFRRLLPFIAIGISAAALAQTAMPPQAPASRTYDEATLKRFEAAKPVNPVVGQGDPYEYYADKPAQLLIPKAMVCALKYADAAKTQYRRKLMPMP